MLYSFDVFDTIITRKTDKPEDIFGIMQKKLQAPEYEELFTKYLRNNFALLRKKTESLAREHYCYDGVEDVTLKQIYFAMKKTGYITENGAYELMQLEVETEEENMLPVAENVSLVQKLRDEGHKIVFISDMYLSEQNIQDILKRVVPEISDIKIYVSSEYRKNKWGGSLYWIVKREEQAEFSEWIHIGDNLHSDAETPCNLGIRALPYDKGSCTQLQEHLRKMPSYSVQVGRTIALSNYINRLESAKGPKKIGMTTGGNILYPYVEWLLDDAMQRGITRLYFIARDGYLLKEIADRLIEARNLPFDTFYIYGSRQAWRLASISERNSDLVQYISWSHAFHILTLQDLVETFEIALDDLMGYLPRGIDRNMKLEKYELYLLVEQLNRSAEFLRFLIEKQKKNRELVVDYLRQEIDISDENYAFVELAGGGYTQLCLSDLLQDIKETHIKNYYYKMDRINDWSKCSFFVFNPECRIENIIIEMICRATQGRTIKYEREGSRVVPVFDSEEATLKQYGYEEYIQGILAYSDHMCRMGESLLENAAEVSGAYLDTLIQHPECEEMIYYMEMPDNVTGRDRKAVPFAPKLSGEQLKELYYTTWFHDREKRYKGSCLELSQLRCTEAERELSYKYIGMACALWRAENVASKSWKDWLPVKLLGERIVLYAAGKIGQEIYSLLEQQESRKVVLWVDKNAEECQKKGLPVENITKLHETEYDEILIAVKDKEVAEQIRKELQASGVRDDRIRWIDLQKVWAYIGCRNGFRWT